MRQSGKTRLKTHLRRAIEVGELDSANGGLLVPVDVLESLLLRREAVIVDLVHGIINLSTNGLLHLLDLLLVAKLVLDQASAKTLNGIALLTHGINLLTSTVGSTRIRHRVTDIAVGDHLQNDGTVLESVLLGIVDGIADRQKVHAIHLDTGHKVTALVELDVRGGTCDTGSHTILVVLTHVDDGQFPEERHVVSFEDLTLVGSSIAIKSDAHVAILSVFMGEGNASSHRALSTYDTIAPM